MRRFGFDVLSQLKQETMPAGQTQTRTYDSAGNLTSLTDYNGKTTTYTYDTLNRLLSRTPDSSLTDTSESFTYTATGKRATMTDASGMTTSTYDNQDRLITKATPQGTLTYTYDVGGNVASMASNHANGASVGYTYDNLNRLSIVVDNRLPVGQNTTTYSYDPASNLATVTSPNGLSSSFTYDDLNRLNVVSTSKGTTIANYNYTLGQTGNRTAATELSGRTANWTYDGIYRLTQETISLDPQSKNGTVTYGLDPVGNRLSQSSSLPGVSTGTFTLDPNDRLSVEQYENNGNTMASGGRTFAYDFENRLKSMNSGAVTIVYDGDGDRVAKTVNVVMTRYLVDDLNPTGYAQVVEELVGGAVQRTYTYGLQRINQNQLISGTWTPSFYGYDGFDSVRTLTDASGAVTDTYEYDAWGNGVNVTGSSPNLYLYRGEQYDPDLGLYYLRARYFNPSTGRFLARDPAEGIPMSPYTLHKYLYASADPVNRVDPSGRAALPIPPPPTPGPEPVPDPAPGGGRSASEYATLVGAISLVAVSSVVQVGDRDACVWYHALDTLSVAALKVALDNNANFSPDKSEGTKQAGKKDCKLPWKCLIKCYLTCGGTTIDRPFWFLGIGLTPDEDVESVCLRAESSNRDMMACANTEPPQPGAPAGPGAAIKHCNRNKGGTRKTWRRPEDAPRVVNGVPQ
jgi:RHS repeat-associated protein